MGPPVLLAVLQIGDQRVDHLAHVEEEVLRGANLQVGVAGDLGARVDQLARVVDAPAVVTLVAARLSVAAVRAGALDIAVGQKAARLRVIELILRILVEKTRLPVAHKHLLRHFPVVLRVGVAVEVEGQPHRQAPLHKEPVILLDHRFVGNAFGRRLSMIGVPWVSEPLTISTSAPISRW